MDLAKLVIGGRARVVRVTGDDDVSQRIWEMGVTPGVLIEVIGAAPLGDPLEVQVRGYRLSMRKTEAARVEVEPLV